METAIITGMHYTNEYTINVQVWKDGIYSGEGRYCKTMKEAVQFIRSRRLTVEDCDVDLLFGLDADDWDVFPEPNMPHGACIEYRQEAYHDVKVYEDGYEDRMYIGD